MGYRATKTGHKMSVTTARQMRIYLAILLLGLLILSEISLSEAGRRRNGKRRKKPKIDELRGLKTSEKVKVVTEKKYLKQDWCKTRPLKQYVRLSNGCKGVFINHFCYGQCNSFYIPRDYVDDPKEPTYFSSCSFCKPYKTKEVIVTLRCPHNGKTKRRSIRRKVTKIEDCRCVAVANPTEAPVQETAPTHDTISVETSAPLPR